MVGLDGAVGDFADALYACQLLLSRYRVWITLSERVKWTYARRRGRVPGRLVVDDIDLGRDERTDAGGGSVVAGLRKGGAQDGGGEAHEGGERGEAEHVCGCVLGELS